MDELTAANLIKSARAAVVTGDIPEAVRLTEQALKINPDDKEGLMLLATLASNPEDKRQALQRVLTIHPFNEEAKVALARLDGKLAEPAYAASAAADALFCANHPDRETRLRCNRCNKPICMDCAVQTPVGYRCRECVRGQQDKFYTAKTTNQLAAYIVAGLGGVALGFGAFLLSRLMGGFIGWIVAFFVGGAVGGVLAEVVWQAAGRKRSRNLSVVVTAVFVVSAAVIALPLALFSGGFLTAALFIGLAASTLYARTRARS